MATTEVIVWPWMVAVVVLAALAAAVVSFLREQPRDEHGVWAANTSYLKDLPAYRRLVRRHRIKQAVAAVVLAATVASVGVLAARPAEREFVSERLATRDIVLCLDVSGSMLPYDRAVMEVFSQLAENFAGERIALVVFDARARTLFPLTDDYSMVTRELALGAERLDGLAEVITTTTPDDVSADDIAAIEEAFPVVAGTWSENESSLIGDGLATCALQFDEHDRERSRTIILATDNEVAGNPVYTLGQAAELTTAEDVTLHGLYGGPASRVGFAAEREYRDVVGDNGGLYFTVDDPDAVGALVDDVLSQQQVELDAAADSVVNDTPQRWFWIALVAMALWIGASRVVRP